MRGALIHVMVHWHHHVCLPSDPSNNCAALLTLSLHFARVQLERDCLQADRQLPMYSAGLPVLLPQIWYLLCCKNLPQGVQFSKEALRAQGQQAWHLLNFAVGCLNAVQGALSLLQG